MSSQSSPMEDELHATALREWRAAWFAAKGEEPTEAIIGGVRCMSADTIDRLTYGLKLRANGIKRRARRSGESS